MSIVLLLVVAFCIVGRAPGVAPPVRPLVREATHRRPSLPAEYLDRAVACLIIGDATESLVDLGSTQWDALVRSVGLTLHAYERGDFRSYIGAREADLEFAEIARADDVPSLHELLAADVGGPREKMPEGWIGALESFWERIHASNAAVHFRVEQSRCRLGSARVRPADVVGWEAGFETLVAALGRHMVLRPAIPHRRSIQDIVAGEESLVWIDLELAFDRVGSRGKLVLRFVRDGEAEWFVYRAVAVCSWGADAPGSCRFIV